jgi:hypothetical protein
VINLMDRAAKIGEITYFRDAMTGDYSLSLHGAIAALATENERLKITIDYLMDKIECLRCERDVRELGSA